MKTPPLVSILIVNYNTRAITVSCIESVYQHPPSQDFEIILVDNGSKDGSAAEIKQKFPHVKLIESKTNLGFGAANNLAAEQANGRFILLLNSDTLIVDDSLDGLLDFARQHPHAGMWGGRTVFADGRLNPGSCWRQMTLWSLFCGATGLTALFPNSPIFKSEAYGGWNRDTIREVDIISGCFMLLPTTLWRKLNGFSPDLFMYGEDADLCLRAKAMGYHPLITPDATIVHYGGASEVTYAGKLVNILSAKLLVYTRFAREPSRSIGRGLFMMYPVSRLVGYWLHYLLVRTDKARENYETWKQVFKHRRIWLRGEFLKN